MADTIEKEQTLEELFEELGQVTDKLSDESLGLEDAFALYKKGMELLKQSGERIDVVEKKVLMLDGEGEINAF